MAKNTIKVIALDIYGTVLSSEDCENLMSPRKGLDKLFDECDVKRIKIVSASDAPILILQIDLKESGVDFSRFDNFYEFEQKPKDFRIILEDYNIKSKELLVVGDSVEADIKGAQMIGAQYYKVPEYNRKLDDFGLDSVLGNFI